MNKKILAILLLLILLMSAVYGCARSGVQLSAGAREQADQILENCLVGLAEENYDQFSQNFSDQMLESLTLESFQQSLIPQFSQAVGTYQKESKEYVRATEENGNTALYYQAEFSKDKVLVKVVLNIGSDPYQITGLWFDSPQLRK